MASVKAAWIKKYGEEEGRRKWEERTRKAVQTLENYIRRYGKDEGERRWNDLILKYKYRFTLPWFIDKYGQIDGPIKYKERNNTMSVGIESLKNRGYTDDEILDIRKRHSKNSARTLENLIKKYGEIEGAKRYADSKEKRKLGSVRRLDYWLKRNGGDIDQAKLDLGNFQKRDLKFFIQKYGDIAGLEKFDVANNKKGRTIDNYIQKYGQEEGMDRYILACRNFKEGQRGIFNSKGQLELENWLRTVYTNVKGDRQDTGIILSENEKNEFVPNNILYPDIIVNDRYIINYNGDFWHANKTIFPEDSMINGRTKTTAGYIRRKDFEKNNIYTTRGYTVIDVWESDWTINKELTKLKIIEAII